MSEQTPQWERLPTYKDYHNDDEDEFGPVNLNDEEPDILKRPLNFPPKETITLKQNCFFLVMQDNMLKVVKVVPGSNYDLLWNQGIKDAKEIGGFWSIWNLSGRFVDGNVVAR